MIVLFRIYDDARVSYLALNRRTRRHVRGVEDVGPHSGGALYVVEEAGEFQPAQAAVDEEVDVALSGGRPLLLRAEEHGAAHAVLLKDRRQTSAYLLYR